MPLGLYLNDKYFVAFLKKPLLINLTKHCFNKVLKLNSDLEHFKVSQKNKINQAFFFSIRLSK